MSRTLKRPMFRRGGPANDGIMSGLKDREQLANGTRSPAMVGQSARDYIEQFEPLLREFTPKTRLPLGAVGAALVQGTPIKEALAAGYGQFVKRDDAREAAIRKGAVSMGLGQALKDATPSKNILMNRRKAIVNIKANPEKFPDGATEKNIIQETARLNKIDETGKSINLQRLIDDREKLYIVDGLPSQEARRLANFEYVTKPKMEEALNKQNIKKMVQGRITKSTKNDQYITRNKPPGIYFDPKTGDIVEITNELEVVVNPPELLALL